MNVLETILTQSEFLINQKTFSIAEKYYITDHQEAPILFVERPRHVVRNLGAALVGVIVSLIVLAVFIVILVNLNKQSQELFGEIIFFVGFIAAAITYFAMALALSKKRHITFYQDDSKQAALFEIKQNNKIGFPTVTYTVRDGEGEVLADLEKNQLTNLFRKRWECFTPGRSRLMVVKEDSLVKALLRRIIGSFFGLLRTNFIFLDSTEATLLGEFNRKMTLRDRYVLDMKADTETVIDRRIALATGILLDTGERR